METKTISLAALSVPFSFMILSFIHAAMFVLLDNAGLRYFLFDSFMIHSPVTVIVLVDSVQVKLRIAISYNKSWA